MPLHSTFLKYFDGVCRYGSIRKAAVQLHISPTAINRAIINYEDEIKLKLFDRTNEGMKLTIAGKILYAHITRTLNDAQETLDQLLELRAGETTQIRICGAGSTIAALLPAVMLDYFKANPDASTTFAPCTTERAIERLINGTSDIGVVFDPHQNKDINIIHQQRLTIGAVVLPNHPLANETSISLEQCADYPLIMPEKSWPLRDILDVMIERKSLAINVIMECGSTEILQSMVSSKIGVGFHTLVGIEHNVDTDQLRLIPIATPRKKYQSLALCVHPEKRISPSFQKLIELFIQQLNHYKGC